MKNTVPTVLIADDNETNRNMLIRRLERHGYNIFTASDGVQALEVVQQRPVDLILLDIMMPHLNGFDVLKRLKGDARLRHIPVIVVSALDDMDSLVKAVELGADDYLFKPFNPVLLNARITSSLERKRHHDDQAGLLRAAQSARVTLDEARLAHLPAFALERLQNDDDWMADHIERALVLVAIIEGLDKLSKPAEAFSLLATISSEFDHLNQWFHDQLFGSLYRVCAGFPVWQDEETSNLGAAALGMLDIVARMSRETGQALHLKIGIDCGSVMGGLVKSTDRLRYEVIGEAVTIATQLALTAQRDSIYVSVAARLVMQPFFGFTTLQNSHSHLTNTHQLTHTLKPTPS